MRSFGLILLAALLASSVASADSPPDLRKVERTIAKEPKYVAAKPLYGLLLFGPAAQTKVWLVLDKSKPDADGYDVLYADLNGNGDLTETSERFTRKGEAASGSFALPDYYDKAMGAKHTKMRVNVSGNADAPKVMIGLQWRGKHSMGGGYPGDPGKVDYMRFGESPATAPVVWANGDGPFQFQLWFSDKLVIGGETGVSLFIGQLGVGPSTFWAFTQYVLPENEGVTATLLWRDKDGKEHQEVSQVTGRC